MPVDIERAVSVSVHGPPLHRDADAQSCTPVAQVRRAMTAGCPGWVPQRASRRQIRAPRSAARRPSSVATTAGGQMGVRAGRKGNATAAEVTERVRPAMED
ncbi:MAG: hypothetical protein ABSG56_18935 [Bryobacteraceae bacterium]|jgi:hypothetical protein